MNSLTKTILLFDLFLSVIVAIDVTCDRVNPLIQSDVTCTCKNAPGTKIDWLIDDVFNSNCVLSSKCAPQYSGYSYSMNTTENVFMMTINSYDYSSCTKITCKDESDGSIKQSITPSSLVFDTTFPTSMTEPGSNNTNGIISVTTGCISGFLDVQYDWYIIIDGLEERYSAHDTSIIDTIDNSLCVNCNSDVNGQRTIGFEHSEASGYETKTGRFKVYLYHVSTNLQLTLTSRYYYTVKVNKPRETDGPANNILRNVLIVLAIVFVIIVIIVIITVQPKFTWIELRDRPIFLEWTDSINCCCKWIFEYHVVLNQKQAQVIDFNRREKSTKERYCILKNLDPMVIYEISLCRTVCCCTCFATTRSVITRKSGMPNDQGYHAKPTKIDIWWTKPDCLTNPHLKYKVTCNEEYKCENTNKASSKIENLVPGQIYEIKIFTILNGIKSLPLEEEVSTPPLKVSIEDVWYEPGISCVECNIKWELKDIDPPKTWKESDHPVFEIICETRCAGRQVFRDQSYSKQFKLELSPGCSYCIKVYTFYHAVRLEPPCVIELTAPCEQALLPEIHLRNVILVSEKDYG